MNTTFPAIPYRCNLALGCLSHAKLKFWVSFFKSRKIYCKSYPGECFKLNCQSSGHAIS